MPKPRKGPRLGGGPSHERLMLANQATELFRHGRIRTTKAKAKTLRPYAERLITKAKRGDVHARRQVAAKLRDRDVVAWLFEEVAPRYSERNGGYTRMLRLGPRKGDSAPMVLVELVDWAWEEGSAEEEIEERRLDRLRGLFGRGRRRKSEPEAKEEALEEGLPEEEPDEPEEAEAAEEPAAEVVETDAEEDEAAPAAEEAPPDLEDVKDADQVPGPAQEPTAPDQDPGKPADLADDKPDAGGTGDPTK